MTSSTDMKRGSTRVARRLVRVGVAFALAGVMASASVASVVGAANNATKTREVVRIQTTSKYGKVLFTMKGFALYVYSHDTRLHSNCAGACLVIWPPLTVPKGIKPVGRGVTGLSVIVRSNGVRQVTYKGWPLYIYVNDKKRGAVSGNAVSSFYAAKLTLKAAGSKSSGAAW